MAWTINYSERAKKSLRKMDRQNAKRRLDFMEHKIAALDNPRSQGKALTGKLNVWRYRMGDYRILCEIKYGELVIVAATIGHRREI